MKQLKIVLTIILMTTLVGCNMNNEKKYDSYEEEMKELTEEFVGNGWYKFDGNNKNHQAVLKDFPYADLEEIPIIRFETETTIAYGYEIKYAKEVKRRNRMMEFGVYDLFQDRYIDFMEESKAGLGEHYEIDGSNLKFGDLDDTNAGELVVSFIDTKSHNTISLGMKYDIEPNEVHLDYRALMDNGFDAVKERELLRKLLDVEIEDYSKWLDENTRGCAEVYISDATGLGFYIDERLTSYLKDSGMEHQEALDYEKQMYKLIEQNMDKSGKEIKTILKDDLGLDSYSWIEFIPDCGQGGKSPVRPTGEEIISRKDLYKGLITYTDVKISPILMTQYYAVYYIHPREILEKYGTENEYCPNCDTILATDDTIDDHNSWYYNTEEFYDNDPDWATTTIDERRDK